jgi:heme exporter protein C
MMQRQTLDWLHYFANPHRFLRFARAALLPSWAIAVAILIWGAWAVYNAPPDYQQGETVRIMFIHGPAAWLALFTYSFIAGASILALIFRHPLGHVAARAAAPIGAVFTLAALITGSLWGQPMWGTWWVWDARLTSVLVLFFIYLGYMAIWRAITAPEIAARTAAILAIVGVINIPIIKFSVDWWNTLHQPASISRFARPAIHPEILQPLLIMAAGFTALFFALLLTRIESEILRQRMRARLKREAGES